VWGLRPKRESGPLPESQAATAITKSSMKRQVIFIDFSFPAPVYR
jgi:hypothetical protein